MYLSQADRSDRCCRAADHMPKPRLSVVAEGRGFRADGPGRV